VADANTRANPNTGKRILLVEDERELRELLAIGLRRAGYNIDTAATAYEARQLIEDQSYALVIADWQLPDGNGIDLADQALKRRARTLVISGYSFGLPAGAAQRHSVVMKPITVYDLVAAVQSRIGNPSA
jgi:DNA-binding response OmpR family regulator